MCKRIGELYNNHTGQIILIRRGVAWPRKAKKTRSQWRKLQKAHNNLESLHYRLTLPNKLAQVMAPKRIWTDVQLHDSRWLVSNSAETVWHDLFCERLSHSVQRAAGAARHLSRAFLFSVRLLLFKQFRSLVKTFYKALNGQMRRKPEDMVQTLLCQGGSFCPKLSPLNNTRWQCRRRQKHILKGFKGF